MRHKAFAAKITALFAVSAMLTGCTIGNSMESLLSPPKLSEEQSLIYNALTESVGKNIKLQYPKSGSYRSAFILEDIDLDGENEAIAFYRLSADDGSDGSLRINILDTRNNKWQSIYDLAGSGTAIDRVLISELGGSGRISVIVGFSRITGDKGFKAYVYDGNILAEAFSDSYSSMFITDMDKNGENELSVIHPNNEYTGKQAFYSLITDDGTQIYESSSVKLNDKTSEFVNIASGYVGTDTPAVYIDGLENGEIKTEIIYCVNGTLRNPLYLSDSEIINDTKRQAGYLSTDIDLDGIIEIPTLSFFPGYTENSRDPFRITVWNVLDNFAITKKCSGYYNISDGYCFIIPNRWDGVVTVSQDSSNGDIVFLKYQSDLLNSTEELMRIAAVTSEYGDERMADGYVLLKKRDNMYYLYKLPQNSSEPLILTETEITNNFYLMA